MPSTPARLFERLSLRLAAAQDMAEGGLYSEAFGYLEGSVQLALDSFYAREATQATDEKGGSTAVELPAYDCADVWRGVESLPLIPVDR